MAVLTKSDRTFVLQNIGVNLADAVRHPDVANLKHQTATGKEQIAPVFLELTRPPPYAVIVPDLTTFLQPQNSRRDAFRVVIHMVHRVLHSPKHFRLLMGTTAIDGIDTLQQAVLDALQRVKPFNDGIHVAANGYTTQVRVLKATARDITAPAFVVREVQQGVMLKNELTMEYDLIVGKP